MLVTKCGEPIFKHAGEHIAHSRERAIRFSVFYLITICLYSVGTAEAEKSVGDKAAACHHISLFFLEGSIYKKKHLFHHVMA